MSSDKPTQWENRIVGFSYDLVAKLIGNPKNFRRHPVEQRRIFGAAAETVGIVAPVLFNDRTGHLLDGHMRVEEAGRMGVETFPTIHLDIPAEDEDIALASLDAISAMAFEDARFKADLLAGIHTKNDVLDEYFQRELERQMAEAASGDDLSALAEKYGQHDPTAFWPVIRIKCDADTRARFMAYFKAIVADDDVARVHMMLDRLKAPKVTAEEYEGGDDE